MRLEELMVSVCRFEIELSEESKEMNKLVGLRTEFELPVDERNELSESVTLLLKFFERAIKSLNTWVKGNLQTCKISYGTFIPIELGRTQGTPGPNIRDKSILCRECGGYGHIQEECTNTKKN